MAERARTQGWPGADSSPVWAELHKLWREAGAADPKLAADGPSQAAGVKFALAVDPDSGSGGEEEPADFGACVQAAAKALQDGRQDVASTYAGQAAALDPSHLAVLALGAELGLLAPVSAARTASLPLWAPASFPCAPRGEWSVVCGRNYPTSTFWSPDGRYLMLRMGLAQPRIPAEPQRSYPWSRLWLWDHMTGELLLLPTPNNVRAVWSPDGKAIYFVHPIANALVKLKLQLGPGCYP